MTVRIGLVTALLMAAFLIRPAVSQQGRHTFRVYNHRLNSLLYKLDRNNDGFLDRKELENHPALIRRLQRKQGQSSIRLDEFRSNGHGPSGGRLRRRFLEADHNGDLHLSVTEARELPGISRRFKQLDRNNDRKISMDELWNYQRALAPAQ